MSKILVDKQKVLNILGDLAQKLLNESSDLIRLAQTKEQGGNTRHELFVEASTLSQAAVKVQLAQLDVINLDPDMVVGFEGFKEDK